MRLARIDRYLLLLAALFGLALLRSRSFPGEDVLPDLFGAVVQGPALANLAASEEGKAQKKVSLESWIAVLRRENRDLRGQVNQARALRKHFDTMKWPNPPRAVSAWVVGSEPDPWLRYFRVRPNSGDGIRITGEGAHARLAVVTGRALLGAVIYVDNRRLCTVRRIDDARFRVEGEIKLGDKMIRGLVVGDGEQTLSMRFSQRAKLLKPGMDVFTSAYDVDIPAGLLIGRIASVEDVNGNGAMDVKIRPAAAFVRLGQVDILIPSEPSYRGVNHRGGGR